MREKESKEVNKNLDKEKKKKNLRRGWFLLCFFKRKRQSKEEGVRLLPLPSLSPVPTT